MSALSSQAYRVAAGGAQIVTSGSSQRVAIPTAADGTTPRYCIVTANGYAYVRLGDNTITAAATDLMVSGQGGAIILATRGFSYVAALQETAGAKVNITPLED